MEKQKKKKIMTNGILDTDFITLKYNLELVFV